MRSLKSFCGAFVLAFSLSASLAVPAFAAPAAGAIVGAPGAAAGEEQQGGNTKAEAAELKITEDQGFVPVVPVPETTAAATKASETAAAEAETKASQAPKNLMEDTAASDEVSLTAPTESAAASAGAETEAAETKAAQAPRNLMDETKAAETAAPETAAAPEAEAKSPAPETKAAETPETSAAAPETSAAPETEAASPETNAAAPETGAAAPDPNGPFRGVDTSEMDVTHGPGAGKVTAGNHGVNEPTVTTGGASATDWSQISDTRERIVAMAKSFIGGTYVYGGSTPEGGFDCSGLVMYVMKNAAGVSLYHQSASQATSGRAVSASEMRPGDIIAYDGSNKDGVVNHVSIYVGDGKCVHAVGTGKGIRMTAWDYDTPFTIRNVLGD